VTGVEMFRKLLDEGQAGDNVGLLLRGVDKTDVERGMVLAKPKSITPHTQFESQVYVLSKEEGGRHTPFFKGYRPQFYFRTTDVTGAIELPENMEMVLPGDNTTMGVDLIAPIAMEEGLRFAIREGGRQRADRRRGARHRRPRDQDRGEGGGARSAPHRAKHLHRHSLAPQVQGQPRALPDAHSQAAHRHHGRHVKDGAGAAAPEPVG